MHDKFTCYGSGAIKTLGADAKGNVFVLRGDARLDRVMDFLTRYAVNLRPAQLSNATTLNGSEWSAARRENRAITAEGMRADTTYYAPLGVTLVTA